MDSIQSIPLAAILHLIGVCCMFLLHHLFPTQVHVKTTCKHGSVDSHSHSHVHDGKSKKEKVPSSPPADSSPNS